MTNSGESKAIEKSTDLVKMAESSLEFAQARLSDLPTMGDNLSPDRQESRINCLRELFPTLHSGVIYQLALKVDGIQWDGAFSEPCRLVKAKEECDVHPAEAIRFLCCV